MAAYHHDGIYLQEQFANVTAIRTGVPLNSASLAEPVVYNIGRCKCVLLCYFILNNSN